ncbi:MAG: FAD-dependent oxidoreductase, partial [Candidatus Uhrbacteria bacterium]
MLKACMQRSIIIIGAGIGGWGVARTLAKTATLEDVQVTLVDRKMEHVFPGRLINLAAGFPEVRVGMVGPAFRDEVERRGIRFVHDEVVHIDRAARHVVLRAGETLPYDALVIACGAQQSFSGVLGAEEHALPLRGVRDALRIRQCIDDAAARTERRGGRARIGIIGGGPIGVELATAISSAHRAVEVMLVERNSRFLDRAPKRLSGVALRQARESGIRVHLDTAVARVNVGVCTLQPRPMKAGEEREHLLCGFEGDSIDVEVDGLIWATGNVYGPLSLAEGLPSDPNGRIRVDNELRVQGERNIFAMGDCAAFGDTGLAPRAAIADH